MRSRLHRIFVRPVLMVQFSNVAPRGSSMDTWPLGYKKGEPDPICHSPFKVESSGKADYLYKAGDNSSTRRGKAKLALKRALCGELSKTLKTLIGSLSKELEPGSIDCNGVSG